MELKMSGESWLHPYQQAEILFAGKKAGFVGKIHPIVCEKFGLPQQVYLFEFSVALLHENQKNGIRFKEIPKFPSSVRDLAVVVDKRVSYQTLYKIITDLKLPILRELKVFDIFTGSNIGTDQYSIAFNLEFNKITSTLTDSEVDEAFQTILKKLQQETGARLR
jgi:phenylalanyl-tRNA synthetase beta chain